MATPSSTIQVSGLGRQKIAALRKQARTLGMTAEGYARQLIEEGISLERQARTQTFDDLFAPAQARFRKSGITEMEFYQLVTAARSRYRRRASGKKG